MSATENNQEAFPAIVELNVGGVFYTTALSTLTKEQDSFLAQLFTGKAKAQVIRDSKGKYFIDRDGVLFRYVLDYLRNQKLVLPENFHEKERLKQEAEHFRLPNMVKCISSAVIVHNPKLGLLSHLPPLMTNSTAATVPDSTDSSGGGGGVGGSKGHIILGYRGTFAFGRDGLADVKFRKLTRILVSGRVSLCRQAFGETLNESRDPDRGTTDRYTCRFFLKHTFLEQAFDSLQDTGFRFLGICASGTNSSTATDAKPGMDSEESKWNHYTEFVFCRS